MTTASHIEQLPTSFGALKPVGHVLIALKSPARAEALKAALLAAGFAPAALSAFTPRESAQELAAMVDDAGALADFGHEIVLMRRYLELARSGHCWLLVKVDDAAQAERVATESRLQDASAAVHYRTFTIEDLI